MAQRALVLGSQIEGLRGVGNDTQRMAAMLDARGFAVDLRVGDAATRAGILAGYDHLIAASAPDDAAVVYYCGHGSHAVVPHDRRSWQCIAPTDLRAGTATDWRGITAWELSIKQAQLTARTRNVTVILDCCHAAQLSRSDGVAGATPRALPHPVHAGFDHHLAALRALHGAAVDAVDPVSDPHAVRLVACGQSEVAFERVGGDRQYHGAFTEALVDVLVEVGAEPVSWAAIMAVVRARVLRGCVRQRPDLEGPARRAPFSLVEHGEPQRVAVAVAGEHYRLAVGRLTGAAVGDVYGVLPDGAPAPGDARPLDELEIFEVSPTTARARPRAGAVTLPLDAIAVPLERRLPRWPVAIDAPPPARAALERALDASATLRAATPGELDALATLRVDRDHVSLEGARGPLRPPARFPAELPDVLGTLANLGVAQGLRELEGEHGVAAAELAIELGVVELPRPRPVPDHGALFARADRYYLSIERRGPRTLFAHVLGVTARGKITLLTHFARSGVALDRHQPTLTLGQRSDGALVGVGLRWPDDLPVAGGPWLTELLVIATPAATDLSGLETRELSVPRSGGTQLQRVLAQLCDGRHRGAPGHGPLDGFLVKRLSLLLAPGDEAT